ncbi:SDR family oxidoreductase [Hyphomonas sp. FCG-A18]|jgi:NAD(P)-dependent dehydrogenase (short-subunit alcohol dehydrogenase family)|uniref:SDR family oxidoreductase n=1 Tax=Hyphomonas sp. FCG-A18 TaxID=3080019 RepID=UPI002B2ACBE9|nr:SDR family oxidoreductase [Hyphomonas sp. FCG-A18]
MKRLQNKTALITGGARGIGAAIAKAFMDQGATVILTDINDDEGQATANQLGVSYAHLDVSKEEDWQAIATRYPQIDVLVNNAGITGFEDGPAPHDPASASLGEWRRVHATNLDGVFLGCRYAINAMRTAGTGSIINIASRSGLVGIPGAAAYASSKAAIINHTRSVALYCAQQGWQIRCNAIAPAAILTEIWEPMLGDGPDREAKMAALVVDTPLKRFGQPGEVAALATMLASDEAAYMTGETLTLDGGLLAGSAASPG